MGVLFATDSVAAGAYPKSARGHFYALLREQWVVTLALTPLSLLLFGQVSLVGFAANLLAIPWVTLVVTPLALAGVVWAPLWSLAAWALQPL
ncbi:ComEC/Rec2 family competence protein, partial [Salmonella sp. s54727]|uniref:ComEC/Rec2 family competence protein n=1 Tax=Salmonella sp. s54727 TaxID=3159668 RepID=UPI00397FF0E9